MPEAAVFELKAPHKGRRQAGLLCQLQGGKEEEDSLMMGGGRGRKSVSKAPDHLQQRAARGSRTGRQIQPRV